MLGKKYFHFPAPLLMNTIHFTMQAVFSKVIIFFRSRKSGNRDEKMSWRDYSIRGTCYSFSILSVLPVNVFFMHMTSEPNELK